MKLQQAIWSNTSQDDDYDDDGENDDDSDDEICNVMVFHISY